VRLAPLTHFPILSDLAIDQRDFLQKLESVKPWLVPQEAKTIEQGPHLQTPLQMDDYYQYSQCINRLLCYAACPQYGLNSSFTGPAALALLHRYNADSRDAGKSVRIEVVNAEDGVWGCTLVGYCSEVCPKGVDPARAVNQNKIESTKDYFLRFLTPRKD
jgi:fumarate reductase iron-sulfur subunit